MFSDAFIGMHLVQHEVSDVFVEIDDMIVEFLWIIGHVADALLEEL